MGIPSKILHGQPQHYTATALADTNSTILAKTGTGILHTLVVTGGTAGTIVLYDNTEASGTVIANLASTNAVDSLPFDVTFTTGLTVSTTAVDTPRLTVIYA